MRLDTLPADHPLRMRPLAEIGAAFLNVGEKKWEKVTSKWKIAQKSFNQLAPVWKEDRMWAVQQVTFQPFTPASEV